MKKIASVLLLQGSTCCWEGAVSDSVPGLSSPLVSAILIWPGRLVDGVAIMAGWKST